MKDKSWLQALLSKRIFLGTTVGAGLVFMAVGVIFWGGFNWSMELTNTEEFCISCHEMRENVYEELKTTVHYSNRSGVRATCPDCHVPKEWTYKIMRKIQASNELLHKAIGSIDTPEKFDAKRLELAKHEWERMKANDSRECRNCHNFESMHQRSQKPRALKQHTMALQEGNTCIDCHKGIAHTDVRHLLSDEEIEELEAPDPSHAKPNALLHLFEQDILDDKKAAEEEAARLAAEEKARQEAEEKARLEAEAKQRQDADAAKLAVQKASDTTKPVAAKKQAVAENSAAKSSINWDAIEGRKITLFYPGTASIEWIHGREHGGKRAFTKGERCMDCHDDETADMGKRIVTGEKLEETPIPGKRGSIPVNLKAAYTDQHLLMQFKWPDTKHAPVPFVDGGKMDPENPVKLAMMFGNDDVEYADRSGCWGSCHDDVKSMPGEVEPSALTAYSESKRLDISGGLTKYIAESRTDIEMKGRGGKKLGGWDKLKPEADVQAELDAHKMLDLVRYQIGTGKVEDGYVLDERKMNGGQGASFTARKEKGNWIVEMKRPLKSNKKGDVSFEPGKSYNFGFAIHDDYSQARFHHVSLGYKVGIENPEADINAVKSK